MYSAFGSFYIPSCIMVFVYIKIYYAARERARRNITKPKFSKRISRRLGKATSTPASKGVAANSAQSQPLPPPSASHPKNASNNGNSIATISGTVAKPAENGKTKKTTRFSADTKPGDGCASHGDDDVFEEPKDPEEQRSLLSGSAVNWIRRKREQKQQISKKRKKKSVHIMSASIGPNSVDSESASSPTAAAGRPSATEMTEVKGQHPYGQCQGQNGTRTRRSVGVSTRSDMERISLAETKQSDAGESNKNVVRLFKLKSCVNRRPSKEAREVLDVGKSTILKKSSPSNGVAKNSATANIVGITPMASAAATAAPVQAADPPVAPVVVPKLTPEQEAEKERKRIARKKERRATLILGLIMGSFIACWFPFFFLYSISPVCPICEESPDSPCCVQAWGFSFAFWLGYSNSALNPVIYTVFNKDFRRAFKRILFK